jgi:hypothetical protein
MKQLPLLCIVLFSAIISVTARSQDFTLIDKKDPPCTFTKANDGQKQNKKQGIALRIGPPGVQNGQPNPAGLSPADIGITYVTRCGFEYNVELVPGLTAGIRYRLGNFLYGSFGPGILISANGYGPGIYTGFGMTLVRSWPVTFELEYKQGLGIGLSESGARIITPYALRIGGGFYW